MSRSPQTEFKPELEFGSHGDVLEEGTMADREETAEGGWARRQPKASRYETVSPALGELAAMEVGSFRKGF